MRHHRNLKIAGTIQKELSKIIERDFEFGALVTVLDVSIGKDLLKTTVNLGIIPREKGLEVWQELEDRKRELRHKLLQRIKIKSVPTLNFRIEKQTYGAVAKQ